MDSMAEDVEQNKLKCSLEQWVNKLHTHSSNQPDIMSQYSSDGITLKVPYVVYLNISISLSDEL